MDLILLGFIAEFLSALVTWTAAGSDVIAAGIMSAKTSGGPARTIVCYATAWITSYALPERSASPSPRIVSLGSSSRHRPALYVEASS